MATAKIATMLLGVLWDHAADFCKNPLGMNPAHGLLKVYADKNPHKAWPNEIIEAFLREASDTCRPASALAMWSR
jgi:hypothetical protein